MKIAITQKCGAIIQKCAVVLLMILLFFSLPPSLHVTFKSVLHMYITNPVTGQGQRAVTHPVYTYIYMFTGW